MIVGRLKSADGQYTAGYFVMAGILFVGGLLVLCVRVARDEKTKNCE